MAEPSRPLPTFQKVITPGCHRKAPLEREEAGRRMDVSVVVTSIPDTTAALKVAGALADSLNARIRVVAPQVAPFPLPLESPPILLAFSERRLREMAQCCPVETTVQIYLCRDFWETLRNVLPARSLVVIGGRRRWWRTREHRLASKLRRLGHEVIFTEAE